MQYFEVSAEVWVLILDGVEAVRADGDDLLHIVAIKGVYVLLRHDLVEVFVAHATRRIAGASLLHTEYGEIHACSLQDGRH